jgi:hypothetical protein
MRQRRLVVFISVIVVVFHSISALPLQHANFPTASDYALEHKNDDGQSSFTPITATGATTLLFYQFSRLKDWHRPSMQTSDASAIRIISSREGEAVKMVVSVYFGSFDRLDTPRSLEGVPEKPAGVYFARLNETVSFNELSQFGIEPLAMKVVPAKPAKANPPQIINKTKAIEVISVEEARDQYLLSLRNNSSKNITVLNIYVPKRGGKSGKTAQTLPDRPLIPSGQVYETVVHIGRGGRRTPQGYVRDEPEQTKIVIGAVLFDDLTYEGEIETAVRVAADRRGQKIQIARLVALIDKAIESPDQVLSSVIGDLRKEVVGLSEEPEQAVMQEVAESFPSFEEQTKFEIKAGIIGGLKSGKESMLHAIRDYDRERVDRGTVLQVWLNRIKKQYEELLGKL